MNPREHKQSVASRKRSYLVHLLCLSDQESDGCRYMARIRPWAHRGKVVAEACERTFADDSELVATINPLLPHGSDIRFVLGHIEGPSGFLYLLRLTREQARQLGWRE